MSAFTTEMKDSLSRIIGATPKPDGRFSKMCLAVDGAFGASDLHNPGDVIAGKERLIRELREIFTDAQMELVVLALEDLVNRQLSYKHPGTRKKPGAGRRSFFAGIF